MNTITITGNDLVIEPHGFDKLWGFRRHLVVPLRNVRGATVDIGVADEPKGIRAPGLEVPGKVVGTFRRDGDATFWNVSDPRDNVVIQFADEDFARAVLTVADPVATEKLVNDALHAAR